VDLVKKIEFLGQRNKTLAEILGDALNELRTTKENSEQNHDANSDEAFNRALAKIQSVQNSLEDPSVQTPTERTKDTTDSGSPIGEQVIASPRGEQDQDNPEDQPLPTEDETTSASPIQSATTEKNVSQTEVAAGLLAPPVSLRHPSRPSLAQTGFSWMLGDSVHRSSFVSSSSVLPEQSRQGDVRYRPTPLFGGGSKEQGRGKVRSEDDGLVLSSLRGGGGNGSDNHSSISSYDQDQQQQVPNK
jgi:TBC1 domain family protein 5